MLPIASWCSLASLVLSVPVRMVLIQFQQSVVEARRHAKAGAKTTVVSSLEYFLHEYTKTYSIYLERDMDLLL